MENGTFSCGDHWSNFGDFIISDDECYVYLPFRTVVNWAILVVGIVQIIAGTRMAIGWWPRLAYAAYIVPVRNSRDHQHHAAGGAAGSRGGSRGGGAGDSKVAWRPPTVPQTSPVHANGTNNTFFATANNGTFTNQNITMGGADGGVIATAAPTTAATPPHTTRGLSLPPPPTPINAIVRASLAAISAPSPPNNININNGNGTGNGNGGLPKGLIPVSSPSNHGAGLDQHMSTPGLHQSPEQQHHHVGIPMITTGAVGNVSSVPPTPQPSPPATHRRGPTTPLASRPPSPRSPAHPDRNSIRNRQIRQHRLAILRLVCGCGHRAMEPALRAALHTIVHGALAIVIASLRLSNEHLGIGVSYGLSILFGAQIIVFFHLLSRLTLDLLRIEARWTTADPMLAKMMQSAHIVIWIGFGLMCATQFIVVPLGAPHDIVGREWQEPLVAAYLLCAGLCCSITNISVPYFSKRLGDRLAWAASLSTISAAQQAERKRLATVLGGLWKPALPAAFICISFVVAAFVPWIRLRCFYLMSNVTFRSLSSPSLIIHFVLP
jgi:hypothetical protein